MMAPYCCCYTFFFYLFMFVIMTLMMVKYILPCILFFPNDEEENKEISLPLSLSIFVYVHSMGTRCKEQWIKMDCIKYTTTIIRSAFNNTTHFFFQFIPLLLSFPISSSILLPLLFFVFQVKSFIYYPSLGDIYYPFKSLLLLLPAFKWFTPQFFHSKNIFALSPSSVPSFSKYRKTSCSVLKLELQLLRFQGSNLDQKREPDVRGTLADISSESDNEKFSFSEPENQFDYFFFLSVPFSAHLSSFLLLFSLFLSSLRLLKDLGKRGWKWNFLFNCSQINVWAERMEGNERSTFAGKQCSRERELKRGRKDGGRDGWIGEDDQSHHDVPLLLSHL